MKRINMILKILQTCFLQTYFGLFLISSFVSLLLWLIFIFRNKIIDRYIYYEQRHMSIVLLCKIIGTAAIVFMIIINRNNIFSFLKSKTAPTWFSAFGTISTVIIALLPKLRTKTDLNLNALIENEKLYNFRIKFEIMNGADNNVKVFPSANLEYFCKDKKGKWVKLNSNYNISCIERLAKNFIMVRGLETTLYETKKININIEKDFRDLKPSLVICVSSILVSKNIEMYHDVRIYEVKNNEFIEKYETKGKNLGKIKKDIEDIYKIKI